MDQDLEKAEWARLVYRNQIDGIESTKRRQWATTYYILLLYAAIIGFAKLYGQPCAELPSEVSAILIVISNIINVLGMYHLMDIQLVMSQYRKKCFNLGKNFYPFVAKIDFVRNEDAKFTKYIDITLFFIFLLLCGLILVLIYLSRPLKFETCWLYPMLIIVVLIHSLFAWLCYCCKESNYRQFINKIEKANR